MSISADIARTICSLLDNDTMLRLYLLGLIPSLKSFSGCNLFWHQRVLVLTSVPVELSSSVDWKQTYQCVHRSIKSASESCCWEEADNDIALMVLGSMKYEFSNDSICAATCHRATKCVRWLLANTTLDPNARAQNTTALMIACCDGMSEIALALLGDQRVNINSLAIEEACACRDSDLEDDYVLIVSELILRSGVRVGCSNKLIDICSLWGDNAKMCELLLTHHKISTNIELAFREVVSRDRLKMVTLLATSDRCVISDRAYTEAVRWCLSHRRIRMVSLLLSLRAVDLA